jgi:PAS domain S-box-containing protein
MLDTLTMDPLRLSHTHLRQIADSGVVGVVFWDMGGQIVEANDRFLEIVGYSRRDLEDGRLAWPALLPDGMRARHAQAVEKLRLQGIARAEEREYRRRDGTPVFARVHSTLLQAEAGKAISIVVDVSEQRRAEAERESLMERERLAREEAESAVRSRDDILAIVSHDLRNPLNIVAMSVAMLQTPLEESRRIAQLGIIRRAVAGMNRLIGDLMDVTQVTAGRLAIDPRPLAVADIFEDARLMLTPLLTSKDQQFDCEAPAGAAEVFADRERIAQVLANLVGNAHKFTPEGGRILLRGEVTGGEVLIEVTDTGPGLSAQDLPHIFDRFWQARRVRRGGVGLGLPITKGIVDAHHGRIWAQSKAGVGTSFFFTLPLHAAAPHAGEST